MADYAWCCPTCAGRARRWLSGDVDAFDARMDFLFWCWDVLHTLKGAPQ